MALPTAHRFLGTNNSADRRGEFLEFLQLLVHGLRSGGYQLGELLEQLRDLVDRVKAKGTGCVIKQPFFVRRKGLRVFMTRGNPNSESPFSVDSVVANFLKRELQGVSRAGIVESDPTGDSDVQLLK